MAATVTSLTVDRLLDAALSTFDEMGYSATPVPAIAARADVAVGSLYRYFASKEHMANALYRREKQRLAATVFADFDPEESAQRAFARLWEGLVTFAVEHTAALCFLELHHHGAYLDGTSQELAVSLDAQIAQLVHRWQERGEIRAGDPALLHAQVFGGFVAVVRQLRIRGEPITRGLALTTLEPAWGLLART